MRRTYFALVGIAGLVVLGTGIPVAAQSGPLAEAGLDQHVEHNRTVHLDAGGSVAPDGEIVAYEWNLTAPDGAAVDPACPSCETTTFVARQRGTYDVTVTVTDDEGRTATDTMYVHVEVQRASPVDNGTPTPSPAPTPTPSTGTGSTSGSSSTPTLTATPTPTPTSDPCETDVEITGVEFDELTNDVHDYDQVYGIRATVTVVHETDGTLTGTMNGDQSLSNPIEADGPGGETYTMTFDDFDGNSQEFEFHAEGDCSSDTLTDEYDVDLPYEHGAQLFVEKVDEEYRQSDLFVTYETGISESAGLVEDTSYDITFHQSNPLIDRKDLSQTREWIIAYPGSGTYSVEGTFNNPGGGEQQYVEHFTVGDTGSDEYVVYSWETYEKSIVAERWRREGVDMGLGDWIPTGEYEYRSERTGWKYHERTSDSSSPPTDVPNDWKHASTEEITETEYLWEVPDWEPVYEHEYERVWTDVQTTGWRSTPPEGGGWHTVDSRTTCARYGLEWEHSSAIGLRTWFEDRRSGWWTPTGNVRRHCEAETTEHTYRRYVSESETTWSTSSPGRAWSRTGDSRVSHRRLAGTEHEWSSTRPGIHASKTHVTREVYTGEYEHRFKEPTYDEVRYDKWVREEMKTQEGEGLVPPDDAVVRGETVRTCEADGPYRDAACQYDDATGTWSAYGEYEP